MIRKDALCFPAEILTASSTRLIASQCKTTVDALIVGYVRMLNYCRENPLHDLRTMSSDEVWAITGVAIPSPFMGHFFLPSGRLRYFDEYMMPGIKERGGAARRQKAFRERRKSPTPVPRIRKRPEEPSLWFDQAWSAYPKRGGGNPRPLAAKAFAARVREGVDPTLLVDAARRYAKYCEATNRVGTEYVMQASTFFGTGGRWQEEWVAPVRAQPKDELDNILDEVNQSYALNA
jgi:hypothetical protein